MKKILILALLLSGCAIINYEAKPDGSTKVSSYALGTTTSLSGAHFKADGIKREFSVDDVYSDQVDGLKQINQGISLIVEGAAKAAK